MTTARLHPVDFVFGTLAGERFPAISEAMGQERGIEQFLMAEPAIELLGELRPDDGLGDAVTDFVTFVHAAWAWWADGQHSRVLDLAATTALLRTDDPSDPDPGAWYIQVAARRLWARIDGVENHEPLDGWFSFAVGGKRRAVACLGLHPARPGLSVLVAEGYRPDGWQRPDGTPAFAPRMAGGLAAGLASIDSTEELLLLTWNLPAS